MGETDEQLVDVAFALRDLDPDSVPVNFLIPFEGTPLGGEWNLTPQRCLRILAMVRFVCPDAEVRLAGGREVHLRSLQPLALHIVNSIFLGDYLTSEGQSGHRDLEMIADAGFTVEGADERTLPGTDPTTGIWYASAAAAPARPCPPTPDHVGPRGHRAHGRAALAATRDPCHTACAGADTALCLGCTGFATFVTMAPRARNGSARPRGGLAEDALELLEPVEDGGAGPARARAPQPPSSRTGTTSRSGSGHAAGRHQISAPRGTSGKTGRGTQPCSGQKKKTAGGRPERDVRRRAVRRRAGPPESPLRPAIRS